jgi:hypothetical protein
MMKTEPLGMMVIQEFDEETQRGFPAKNFTPLPGIRNQEIELLPPAAVRRRQID